MKISDILSLGNRYYFEPLTCSIHDYYLIVPVWNKDSKFQALFNNI